MRMRPDQVPEPSQRPRPVGLGMTGVMDVRVAGYGPVPGLAPVNVAGAIRTRLRISHATQDARNIRLQHVNNSDLHASAKHLQQPGQADASSSPSRSRTR